MEVWQPHGPQEKKAFDELNAIVSEAMKLAVLGTRAYDWKARRCLTAAVLHEMLGRAYARERNDGCSPSACPKTSNTDKMQPLARLQIPGQVNKTTTPKETLTYPCPVQSCTRYERSIRGYNTMQNKMRTHQSYTNSR